MRLGLSERTAIEAGIYNRASFAEIAKQIGVSKKTDCSYKEAKGYGYTTCSNPCCER